ncbi:MAG TPA: hypothetical protein PK078_09100 [Anaerolineales bacterium]|nr:hypothetical protein [Anaerolineales bacterium]HNA90399.1 hypothetical protein [Anaerolineales bacterium]HNC07944.1 hypothetical protein [Anaerolineales bacterium]
MAVKNSKPQKQLKSSDDSASKRQRAAQIMFAIFAIILIASMVLSAVATY